MMRKKLHTVIKANLRLSKFMQNMDGVSLCDVQLLFTMLNCPSLCESGIVKNNNKVGELREGEGSD